MGKRHRYSSRDCGFGVGCGCSCCSNKTFPKYASVVFSTLFLAAGALLMYYGIWAKLEKNFVSLQQLVDRGLNNSTLSTAWTVIIVSGLFLAVVSTLGCVAVCFGRKCLVAVYALGLLLLVCCGFAVAVVYGGFSSNINDELSGALTNSLSGYQEGSDTAKDWDNMQTWMRCCGSGGPKDYSSIIFSKSGVHVPRTCCILTNSDLENPHPLNETACQIEANKIQNGTEISAKAVHSVGCYKALEDYIESKLSIIVGVGVTISILQILGICLAIMICCAKDGKDGGL